MLSPSPLKAAVPHPFRTDDGHTHFPNFQAAMEHIDGSFDQRL
jgi:hypothetical protein